MQFQAQKAYLLAHFQEYRIIQPCVVFIHGLPSALSSPNALQKQLLCLGHTLRINTHFLSKDFYSAFVEFQKELNAALLILMLNQLSIENRSLRVFYGSTKFCPHFLKNHRCMLSNCNYAHYYVPHLTHLRDQAKEIDHTATANISINQELPQALQKINAISTLQQKQLIIANVCKERLQYLANGLNLYQQPQQIGKGEREGEEWESLGKEIDSEIESEMGSEVDGLEDRKEELGERGVEVFLDAAERFLTRLIFQSSMFVY